MRLKVHGLERRYGRARREGLWAVQLQVISASRPGLRHQLEYVVRAASPVEAIGHAKARAARDGHEVLGVVGNVVKRPG